MEIRDEDDARTRVTARLQPGERIVWVGCPDPNVNFTAADGFLIPFGLFFFGFGLFWEFGGTTAGYGNSGPPVGIPFLVVGLYYLVGRFIYKRIDKLRTVYAITTSRAMILRGSKRESETPTSGQTFTTTVAGNGFHLSVTFGPPPSNSIFGQRRVYPNTGLDPLFFIYPTQFAFYDVADVDGLNSALAKSRETSKDQVTNA